jgi:hypothetical protein
MTGEATYAHDLRPRAGRYYLQLITELAAEFNVGLGAQASLSPTAFCSQLLMVLLIFDPSVWLPYMSYGGGLLRFPQTPEEMMLNRQTR